MTVVKNENNELIPTKRMCVDYLKLNEATRKDYFSLPLIDQMLKCYLDGYLGFFKSLSTLMTKTRLLLHVLMVHMLIEEFHLGYAMPLPHFNVI